CVVAFALELGVIPTAEELAMLRFQETVARAERENHERNHERNQDRERRMELAAPRMMDLLEAMCRAIAEDRRSRLTVLAVQAGHILVEIERHVEHADTD